MTKQYWRIARAIQSAPWAILPEKLDEILGILQHRIDGGALTDEQIAARISGGKGNGGQTKIHGAVAVIPVYGVISQRLSIMQQQSGGTSTEDLAAAFRAALADAQVGSILLDVSSPGGSVYGVAELANEIRDARGKKPICAIANSLAASAAYWIASAADELVVTPGGQVGSIGVYMAHEDWSKALEKEGVSTTLISAGKYKTEGNPYGPLSEEARQALQDQVDGYYAMFVKAVAQGRGATQTAVREGFGQGRCVLAADAVKAGMADRVATFNETVARLAGNRAAASGARAADELIMPVADEAAPQPAAETGADIETLRRRLEFGRR